MLKGKKWIAFLTMFLFVAALTFLSRENGSAKRQEVWSNTMADSGYELSLIHISEPTRRS